MVLEASATLLLGALCFWGGMKLGRSLSRRGMSADNIFKGKNLVSVLFLGLYVLLVAIAVNLPQAPVFPQSWRVYGLQISWTFLRVTFLGFCGIALTLMPKVGQKPGRSAARKQLISVALLAVLGVGGFSVAEGYILAPIDGFLTNNLQPNGVFKQTSMTSCAPASLATILRLWKIPDATEVSVAKAAGTSRLGTSMPQLIDAAHKFDMEGMELAPTWEQMRQMNRPGVLAVWLIDRGRQLPHATALVGMDAAQAAVADPSSGKIYLYSRSEFEQIWRKQYVPIYRPQEVTLFRQDQAQDYLKKLGFLDGSHPDFKSALIEFQRSHKLNVTGILDPQTTLLLMGPFLKNVPTLKDLELSQ